MKYPFEDPPDTAVIICRHIVHDRAPILFAAHEEDGMWQFMCGGVHGMEDAMVVALEEAFELDPSVGHLSKMPFGYEAERVDLKSDWIIRKTSD